MQQLRSYLRDAKIRPIAYHDGIVDLELFNVGGTAFFDVGRVTERKF